MEEIQISGKKLLIEQVRAESIAKKFVMAEKADFHYVMIVYEADVTIDIILAGKESKAEVSCIFLSKNSEKITAKINTYLSADHASANIYLLSLLGEKADINVDGGINIAPDVIKTSGHLLEENVVLGKKVKVKTLPMLDVRSSDVSASHGAKIDRLDENKLFYMMAKGLDQKQAQKLIVQGYIERIFAEFDSAEKEKEISHMLDYLGMAD